MEKIPQDESLYIFDDDSFTGGTLKFANKVLENHKILGNITLVSSNPEKAEILDLRDFVFGDNNGLSILAPDGTTFRAPYIYPFVDPFIRASVIDPIEFSKEVWKLNYEHYLKNDKLVGDSPMFNCLAYVGFKPTAKVSEVCKYYIKNL